MLKKIICSSVLATIFSVVVFSQEEINFDELFKVENDLSNVEADSVKANKYHYLFTRYRYLDSVKSEYYMNQYLKLALKRKDTVALGLYYYELCARLFYAKEYLKSGNAAKLCMFYSKGKDPFCYLESGLILSRSYYFTGQLSKAYAIGKQLVDNQFYKPQYNIQVAKCYFNIGLITMHLLQNSSITYFYKTINYLADKPKNKVILPCYHAISSYYRERNQLDSAIKYALWAVQLARNDTMYSPIDFISPANNLQQLLERAGRNVEAQKIAQEIRIKQYDVSVSNIVHPKVSQRVTYLEHLRSSQKNRFMLLLVASISIFLILTILAVFLVKVKKKEKALSQSLRLNKVLVKETNHRVKNNYQIMMSMLNVHASEAGDSLADFVEQTRARIASMARVHELFLQNTIGDKITVQTFFDEVLHSLESSLSMQQKRISIELNTQPYTLAANKIVTLGLIINELVVNAVKYAFGKQQSGTIKITFQKKADTYILLFVDDGIGFTKDADQSNGVGMSMLSSLAAQLKGAARFKQGKQGTIVEIEFEA